MLWLLANRWKFLHLRLCNILLRYLLTAFSYLVSLCMFQRMATWCVMLSWEFIADVPKCIVFSSKGRLRSWDFFLLDLYTQSDVVKASFHLEYTPWHAIKKYASRLWCRDGHVTQLGESRLICARSPFDSSARTKMYFSWRWRTLYLGHACCS